MRDNSEAVHVTVDTPLAVVVTERVVISGVGDVRLSVHSTESPAAGPAGAEVRESVTLTVSGLLAGCDTTPETRDMLIDARLTVTESRSVSAALKPASLVSRVGAPLTGVADARMDAADAAVNVRLLKVT